MMSHPKTLLHRVFSLNIGLILVLGLMLAACGEQTPAPPTATTAATTTTLASATTASATTTQAAATTEANAANTTTLEMWIMPNTSRVVEDMQKVLADFYVQNPNIKVNVTRVDWGVGLTRLQDAIKQGQGPDVTQMGWSWIGALAASGGLRPFTEADLAPMGGVPNFAEVAWTTSKQAGGTEAVAIPWFVDTRAIFYRTDVVQKAGLDPATAFKDWDSFLNSLKKMKETGLVKAPFAHPGKGEGNVVHNLAPWIWSAGGDMLSADNTKAAFNSEAGIKGVQFYSSLYAQGLVLKEAIEKNTGDVETFFRNGDVGAIITGPWMIRDARLSKTQSDTGYAGTVTANNLGVAQIPAGPGGSKPFVGGSNLGVLKSSKNQAAAVKLVQYMASKKVQNEYASLSALLPATLNAQADFTLVNDPLYKPFLQSVKDGRSYPTIATWGTVQAAMVKSLGLLWDDVAGINGPFDASKVKPRLDAAAQEVNTVITSSK